MIGTKHLIQCHCVLPQFRKMSNPIFHKFVVYSKFKDDHEDQEIKESLARCNNCDAVHRIIDLCKSEIVVKIEDTDIIVDLDEIKIGLPDKLVSLLEKNNCDIPTYESIDHIFEKQSWNSEVVISRQTVNNEKIHVKILEIKSENKFRIKSEKIDLTTG
jgi:hypothetical protein|tara:strand:- start:487 stop:963 length:477 start_codon:yes stop_codon:yes gene_type:complete